MKDYLGTNERTQLALFMGFVDRTEIMIDAWKNNLTPDEKKRLKTIVTNGLKVFESILKRQNPKSLRALDNSVKNANIYVVDSYSLNQWKLKVRAEQDAAYEENKDYFKLIELAFDMNCKNCTTNCNECELYGVFEDKCIFEYDGTEKSGNCKYSWKDTRGNKDETNI